MIEAKQNAATSGSPIRPAVLFRTLRHVSRRTLHAMEGSYQPRTRGMHDEPFRPVCDRRPHNRAIAAPHDALKLWGLRADLAAGVL